MTWQTKGNVFQLQQQLDVRVCVPSEQYIQALTLNIESLVTTKSDFMFPLPQLLQQWLVLLLFQNLTAQWTTQGHKESSRVCDWGRVCVVLNKARCKQDWHHVWALEIVRHRLYPKLPLLETLTLFTNTPLRHSFLIETLHPLPCKHPARSAGAFLSPIHSASQKKST